MMCLAMLAYLVWRFDRQSLGRADLAVCVATCVVGEARWAAYIS